MCGILGGSNNKWNYEAGVESIRHRGPDDTKIMRGEKFSLAFARLSVIDLSDAAMQPMESAGGDVIVVYNGEIYGYEVLKKKLEKRYPFRSNSDTEVILYAYMEYGDKFVEHIDGIFAIAIYDKRDQTIHLFRDRAGVKPLYYYNDGKHFAFGSELKALSSILAGNDLKLDYTALYDYLTYAYVPAPKSMYLNIRQLKPAHKLVYYINRHTLTKQKRYWSLPVNTREGCYRKEKVLVEELRNLIHDSVREQMVADVPVGTFLSGGVDSSIITYEALQENSDIESFSIGFTEKRYDESKYYKRFADEFIVRVNEQIFDRAIFRKLYKCLLEWFDEPFADLSAFPTYLVSCLAREKVTVALTGDGGDELFGGYSWYEHTYRSSILGDSAYVSRLYEKLVSRRGSFQYDCLEQLFCETLCKFCACHGYELKRMKTQMAKKWGISDDYDDYWFLREYDNKELPMGTRLQYIDFHTYLPEILTKVDRASMQVSLEARVPFLSRKVIEFAFSLTPEERCPKGEMKYMLRKAYPEIPKTILYKRKQGFCMPREYVIGEEQTPNKKILREVWNLR